MFARFRATRKVAARIFAFVSLAWLAACDLPIPTGANTGPTIDATKPVQVALLVPGGSAQNAENLLAQNFENAARLAIADLEGVQIELRVYNTGGGNPDMAANAAKAAVNDGAKIILGPLFGEAANAAGVAVAGRNVNVLAFSNNPSIAGGNVFVLGPTFDNTANRLVRYAAGRGINRFMVLHSNTQQGEVGRDAIVNAAQRAGAEVVASRGYALTQQAIISETRSILSTARSAGAQAIFTPAGAEAELPILATVLPDAGLNTNQTRFIGLTRWDTLPQLAAIPGLEGGYFAMPDTATTTLFSNRYAATYGSAPHPLAGLAYDGIAAIGALVAAGNDAALTKAALTSPQGFRGTSGIFRLLPNGLNERALAVATIQNNQVVILEQAQRSFGGAGL